MIKKELFFRGYKSILKPDGVIAIMTQTLTQNTDFKAWYYKNDPSHIGFYNQNL